ncbi:MAG: hypothetical protein QOJ65_197 [Fimbriimonadaceae bacterium]|nr:hypothetical protein [Fimbriimonadaceae bacterium]
MFLRLLCDVFGLDFSRAHRIFFTEPMFDLNRKWGLFRDGEVLSILTTVPLEFGWGKAMGIAGVATRGDSQRKGLATKLLESVLLEGRMQGEEASLLFAKEPVLYERLGFSVLDEVVRGPIQVSREHETFHLLDFQEVSDRYGEWALQDPSRLRRDDRRWGYWRWNLRVCTAFGDGYICTEAGVIRECVVSSPVAAWPLPAGSEWLGLQSMADEIGVPLKSKAHELHLMGLNVPVKPQMFMTDQF